jgi:hypothetical protein
MNDQGPLTATHGLYGYTKYSQVQRIPQHANIVAGRDSERCHPQRDHIVQKKGPSHPRSHICLHTHQFAHRHHTDTTHKETAGIIHRSDQHTTTYDHYVITTLDSFVSFCSFVCLPFRLLVFDAGAMSHQHIEPKRLGSALAAIRDTNVCIRAYTD